MAKYKAKCSFREEVAFVWIAFIFVVKFRDFLSVKGGEITRVGGSHAPLFFKWQYSSTGRATFS